MRMKTTTTLLAATLLLPAPAFAAADTDWLLKGENVKVEIFTRCNTEWSEYGPRSVKRCIDKEIEAIKTINAYSDEHASILERCMGEWRK